MKFFSPNMFSFFLFEFHFLNDQFIFRLGFLLLFFDYPFFHTHCIHIMALYFNFNFLVLWYIRFVPPCVSLETTILTREELKTFSMCEGGASLSGATLLQVILTVFLGWLKAHLSLSLQNPRFHHLHLTWSFTLSIIISSKTFAVSAFLAFSRSWVILAKLTPWLTLPPNTTFPSLPSSDNLLLHCIALHCIALHCIALHCIALHCIALHCIALHRIALHCIALHCIALQCSAVQCKLSSSATVKVQELQADWCTGKLHPQHATLVQCTCTAMYQYTVLDCYSAL